MEFQLSYSKSWKMMLWKCCTQYARKFGKLSSGHRTGKGQFSFQSQRKTMPKNAQTTTQLHLSHMLVMLKILQARLQQYVNCELPGVQAGFRKGRGTRDQTANICWIIKKAREFQKNISPLLTMPKPLKWSEVKSLSHVQLFATPWIVAHQAPRSMGFSRHEYWSGLPFPSPGDLPDPGIEPGSPAL